MSQDMAVEKPAEINIKISKVYFDLLGKPGKLVCDIECRYEPLDTSIAPFNRIHMAEFDAKHSPTDVMFGIAEGRIPMPWLWPIRGEGRA